MHVVADNIDFFGYGSAQEASIERHVTRIRPDLAVSSDAVDAADVSAADRELIEASLRERRMYEESKAKHSS